MKAVLVLLGLLAATQAFPRAYPQVPFYGLPGKIVGGTVVTPHELPYQLSLRYQNSHVCGASVLDSQYIITAAHCAVIGSASSFSIVAGEHNLNSNEGTEQVKSVAQVSVHSSYNANTFANDIAIMRLSSALTLNSNVRAVTLPSSSYQASGNAIVSGWGTTSEGGSISTTLRKVTVPIITDAACRQAYGSSDILDSMICAGFTSGGRDSCQGDSGGPLAIGNTLVGIVSWGYGCARPNYPGVYTEVAKFANWIYATKALMAYEA